MPIQPSPVPPRPVTATGAHYPSRLDDARAIAAYIASCSTGDVDEDMIEELFAGAHAELTLVPISELREGHPDGNVPSAAKARKYARMPVATMPPLVVEDGTTWDGNHRLRVRRACGDTQCWIYAITYDDD